MAKGGVRLVQGIVMLPPSLLLGRRALVRSLRRMAQGLGSITGLCAGRYAEYREVHGE
jgi:hypothetical protein